MMDIEQKKISIEKMEEVFKETKEEVKKVTKKMDEDLKKVTKKINEDLKKVTKKMDEDLKKVTKQMNEKLEKLEDTIQQAQEELNMELRDLLGDGVKKMTEVDEKPLEHAMSCLKLEEALKDPADASVSAPVLNQRPKRVIKSTPRYK